MHYQRPNAVATVTITSAHALCCVWQGAFVGKYLGVCDPVQDRLKTALRKWKSRVEQGNAVASARKTQNSSLISTRRFAARFTESVFGAMGSVSAEPTAITSFVSIWEVSSKL